MRGAWIEMYMPETRPGSISSLPMRGAWIEIAEDSGIPSAARVAPHAGSVD